VVQIALEVRCALKHDNHISTIRSFECHQQNLSSSNTGCAQTILYNSDQLIHQQPHGFVARLLDVYAATKHADH